MKKQTPNTISKKLLSSIYAILVAIVLIAGSAVYAGITQQSTTVVTGNPLTAEGWNKIITDISNLNTAIDGKLDLDGDASGLTGLPAGTTVNEAMVDGWANNNGYLKPTDGKIGIGTATPTTELEVAGTIYSTAGGIKFPDGTVQTTAGGGGGGATDVKKLIESFVVEAGQTVTAGDIVSFVNGKVKKGYNLNDIGDSLAKGTNAEANPETFAGTVNYNAVAKLTDTTFVVAYQDESNSSYGSAVVGTVSGNNITWGSEHIFNAGTTNYISITPVDATRVAIAYQDSGNNGYGTAVIGTINGTNITFGYEYIFDTYTGTAYISIVNLDSNQIAIAYRGTSNYGTAIVGTVVGNTITFGPTRAFNGTASIYISMTTLDSNRVAIGYSYSSIGYTIIGVVSGNTITYGTQAQMNGGANAQYISMTTLDSNRFVAAFIDASSYGHASLGTVNPSTQGITPSDLSVFNNASTSYVSAKTLDANRVAITYSDDGNSSYGSAIVGTITGTSASWGLEYNFNAPSSTYISMTALDPNKIVVVSRDSNNSNRGSAIIGDIPVSTISFDSGKEFGFNRLQKISDISVAKLTDTTFVMTYRDQTNSNKGTASIGTISGNTVTFGAEQEFHTSATYYTSVATLSPTKIAIAYLGASTYGRAIVGSIAGGTITFGTDAAFNGTAAVSYIKAVPLSATRVLITFSDDGDSFKGKAIVGSVTGNAIAYGAKATFNTAAVKDISTTVVDTDKVLIAYADGANSYKGTAIVSTISDTAITPATKVLFNSAPTSYIAGTSLGSGKLVLAYTDGFNNDNFGSTLVTTVTGTVPTFGTEYTFKNGKTNYISVAPVATDQVVISYRGHYGTNGFYSANVIAKITDTSMTLRNEKVWYESIPMWSNDILAMSTGKVVNVINGETVALATVGDLQKATSIVGIAQEAKNAGETVKVAVQGSSNVHASLKIGEKYFAKADGTLTEYYAPYLQPVGMAIAADTIMLNNPSADQYFGDMVFANEFRITENWQDKQGLTFKNNSGEEILAVNGDGSLKTNNVVVNALQVGNAEAATCDSNHYGVIKYENDNFYGCKSTGWVKLSN